MFDIDEMYWTFCSLLKLAMSYFSGMSKFRNLPLHRGRIYRTLTSLTSFLITQICVATTWQWSFYLISITTPDWMGLWITKQIDFKLQTSLVCKKEKTTSYEKSLLGDVLKKNFLKNFTKFTKILGSPILGSFFKKSLEIDRKFCRKPPVLESSLIKLQSPRTATSLKRDSSTGYFQWNLRNF